MLIFFSDLVDGQTLDFSSDDDTLFINDPNLSAADLGVFAISSPYGYDSGIFLEAPGKRVRIDGFMASYSLTPANLMFADGSWLITHSEANYSGAPWLGGAGDDHLLGAGGDERLIGGGGDDLLNGAAGWDTADYADAPAAVAVDIGITGRQETGGAGMDTLLGIEGLIGSRFADRLHGDWRDNVLEGMAGDDLIDGGGGLDMAAYALATAGVHVDIGISGPQDTGGMGLDTLVATEGLVGSAFDDVLKGNDGDNRLDGGPGVDLLIGRGGNDTFIVDSETDQVLGGAGVDTVISTANAFTLGAGTENLVLGPDPIYPYYSAYPAQGVGNEWNNVLTGNQGDNLLDGRGGVDTASYADMDGTWGTECLIGVHVSLAAPGPQETHWGADTLIDIENLQGSDFGDRLLGDGNDNRLDGGLGADTLAGGLGDDILRGGAGPDTASYLNAPTGVQVRLGLAGPTDTLGAGSDTLVGIENLQGSGFDDVLRGDGGNNLIDGLAGNDDLSGGDGYDLVSYAETAAGVTVRLSIRGAQETGGAGVDTLSRFEGIIGSAFADTLTGDSGPNRLVGGGGADTLAGLGGNDVYVLDSGHEAIRERPDEGRDLVIVGGAYYSYVAPENVENIKAVGNLQRLTGNALSNRFTDLGSSNAYSGGAGFDTLSYARHDTGIHTESSPNGYENPGIESIIGSAFDDEFTIDNSYDVRRCDGGTGIDTLVLDAWFSPIRLNLATTEAQPLGAASVVFRGFENLTAGRADDLLTGNASNNILKGDTGNDTLSGDGGDDTLYGGGGMDTLTGGQGADAFRFTLRREGSDHLTDFIPGEDHIEVSRSEFGNLPVGALATERLVGTGDTPSVAGAVFVYDSTAGGLSFDPDGAGPQAAFEIARLTPGTALTANDILIYS